MSWISNLRTRQTVIANARKGWICALQRNRDFLLTPSAAKKLSKDSSYTRFNLDPPLELGVQERRNLSTDLSFHGAQNCDVAVLGAGPSGGATAIWLKRRAPKLRVVLVERRSTEDGSAARPYTREWLTFVKAPVVWSLLTTEDRKSIEAIGARGFIGVTIKNLEFALFRATQALGIPLCNHEGDLDGAEVRQWIDATGGRLPWQGMAELGTEMPLQGAPADSGEAYDNFGCRIRPLLPDDKLALKFYGDAWRPTLNQTELQVPYLKITKIDPKLKPAFFERFFERAFTKGLYFWNGFMQPEMNEALLICCLTQAELDALDDCHRRVCSLSEACASEEIMSALGPRLGPVIAWLAEHQQGPGPFLEPTFTWAPYVRPRLPRQHKNAPIVTVGDSVYTGNPQAGNGLAPHLFELKQAFTIRAKSQQ